MLDKSFKTVLIFAGLWMTGCTSDTEERAIYTIKDRYKCQLTYSKSFSATSSGSGKSFEVTLAASSYIDSLVAQEPASFSAFTIYDNFTPEERQKYSLIRITVVQTQDNNNKTTSYEYDLPKLALVVSKYYLFEQTIENLKKRQYDNLFNQFEPSIGVTIDTGKQTHFLDSLQTSYGDINNYQFRGFYLFDETLGNQVIHLIALKGVLIRNKDDHNFNIFVSQEPKDKQLYGVTFQ